MCRGRAKRNDAVKIKIKHLTPRQKKVKMTTYICILNFVMKLPINHNFYLRRRKILQFSHLYKTVQMQISNVSSAFE